jgi:predicted ester cyclase
MRDGREANELRGSDMAREEREPRIVADSALSRWNADIVKTFFRVVLATGDAQRAATFLAEEFRDGDEASGSKGAADVIARLEAMWSTFPDGRWTLLDIVAAQDLVAARSVFNGAQLGAFGSVAPTGRRVEVAFMDFYVLGEGRISAHWHVFDEAGLLRQLGAA